MRGARCVAPWRGRGLSLLEVLITIAIFAMLFAVLTFGWSQSMSAQARVALVAERTLRVQQLNAQMRALIGETLVPQHNAGVEFSGDRSGFVAESSSSLDPKIGAAPLPTELKLRPDNSLIRLQLRHGDDHKRDLPWALTRASLSYVDSSGARHDSWPPRPARIGDTLPFDRDTYLPSLVLFTYQFIDETSPHTLMIAPRSSSWRLVEPGSPISGLGVN